MILSLSQGEEVMEVRMVVVSAKETDGPKTSEGAITIAGSEAFEAH